MFIALVFAFVFPLCIVSKYSFTACSTFPGNILKSPTNNYLTIPCKSLLKREKRMFSAFSGLVLVFIQGKLGKR